MKILEGAYIEVYSEDVSEHTKTTTGGVRIEILDFDSEYFERRGTAKRGWIGHNPLSLEGCGFIYGEVAE